MNDKSLSHYTLELLDDVIHGASSPESVIRLTDQQLIDYLDEFHPEAKLISILTTSGFLRNFKLLQKVDFPSVLEITPMIQEGIAELLPPEHIPVRLKRIIQSLGFDSESCEVFNYGKNQYMLSNPINWKSLSSDQLKLSYFSVFLSNSCNEIRKDIKASAFSLESDEAITTYIRKNQRELNNFSAAVYERGQFTDSELKSLQGTTTLIKDLYILLYARIHSLLRFLEKNYAPYLDPSSPIPYKSAQLESYNIRIRARNIARKLSEAKVDSTLIHVLSHALSTGIQSSIQSRPTYSQINYLEIVTSKLAELTEQNEIDEAEIIRLMIKFNYNHPEAFKYIVQYVHRDSENLTTSEIRDHTKWIYQIQTMNDMVFDRRFNDLKTSILDWLNTEWEFSSDPIYNIPEKESAKILLGLSVGQLALFIRLLTESGIITTTNQQLVLRAFAGITSTPHAAYISVNSLQNKYYQQDSSTVREVRYKLIEMLNLLKEK